jgi:hypothetical protein
MRLTNARRKTLIAAIGLAAAVTLTACNPGGDNASGNSQSSAPAASADTGKDTGSKETGGSGSSGTSGSGGSGTSGSGGSGSSGGSNAGDDAKGTIAGTGSGSGASATKCRTDELDVIASDNTTDKTEGIVTVQLKNEGGRDCTMKGYAGVDMKTADGSTVSVDRSGETPVLAVLKDGESAAFNITYPANDSGGSGVRPTKILVTPPNETKYVEVAWPGGSMPISDGGLSVAKLEISPAGKVG